MQVYILLSVRVIILSVGVEIDTQKEISCIDVKLLIKKP